jgi:hypothetical protein
VGGGDDRRALAGEYETTAAAPRRAAGRGRTPGEIDGHARTYSPGRRRGAVLAGAARSGGGSGPLGHAASPPDHVTALAGTGVEGLLLLGLVITTPTRHHTQSARLRAMVVAPAGLVSLTTLISLIRSCGSCSTEATPAATRSCSPAWCCPLPIATACRIKAKAQVGADERIRACDVRLFPPR